MTATAFDTSLPFNGEDSYEDGWREILGSWLPDGVIAGDTNELLVYGDSSGRQVKTKTGACRLQGEHGRLTSEKTITLAANASGNPRIDRIVARLVKTGTEQIELDVLQGTPASSPSAPALTRNSSVWEMSLAQIACANAFTTVAADKVTLERFLWSGCTEPAYDSAAARTLWVPSPIVGNRAFLRDTGGLYTYDGSSWVQRLRSTDLLAYQPSGNEDTSAGTWPFGLTKTVAVPKWATRARLHAKIGQAYAVTSTANVDVELQLDTLIGDQDRIRWDASIVTSASARDLNLAGDVNCASLAGTSVTLRTYGQVVSGSGALRVNAESSCFVEVEFR